MRRSSASDGAENQMSTPNLLQYACFLVIVVALARPVGAYMARVFSGQRTWLDPCLTPVERAIYRAAGVDPRREMSWRAYANAFILFTLVGTLLLYAILRLQWLLP
jgi:K+-transporting ATPase ATPase A chain